MAAPSLSVRIAHVLGMAVLLGGGAFAWNELRNRDSPPRRLLRQFEWAFWATIGVMLVSGIGNLGALGAPGPSTRWGAILTAKLLVVLVLLLVSVVRAMVVLRLDDRDSPAKPVRRLHAATVWLLLVIVVLAEVLAHG